MSGLHGAQQQVGGADHQQDEQRVRVVDPGDRDAHGGEREERRRDQAGGGPGDALDRRVQQPDRRAPAERLGQQDREAEQTRGEAAEPERERRLVSTVMKMTGSSEPKNQAFQLTLPDFTAAA